MCAVGCRSSSSSASESVLAGRGERGDTAVIATVVPQRRRVPFVGREAELRALEELLRGETRVICLHGIAGMGKSGVLHAFAQRAHDRGASFIELDCRAVEPTEGGFLQAV